MTKDAPESLPGTRPCIPSSGAAWSRRPPRQDLGGGDGWDPRGDLFHLVADVFFVVMGIAAAAALIAGLYLVYRVFEGLL